QADPDRHPGRVQKLVVAEKLAVPPGREAAPDRDQLRLVEGVDDEEKDRQIEEGEAEGHRDDVEPRGAGVHGRPSRSARRASWFWKMTIGITRMRRRTTATAEAIGQSRLLKNSAHRVLPIISVLDPP